VKKYSQQFMCHSERVAKRIKVASGEGTSARFQNEPTAENLAFGAQKNGGSSPEETTSTARGVRVGPAEPILIGDFRPNDLPKAF
jgi:hypothetical protein